MKTKNMNYLPHRLGKRAVAVCLLLIAFFTLNAHKAIAQNDASITNGSWVASVYENGDAYRYWLNLSDDGIIGILSSIRYTNVQFQHEGTYTKQGNGYNFKLNVMEKGVVVETIEGRFTATVGANKLHFTLLSCNKSDFMANFKSPGVDFYNHNEPIPVKLSAKANIIDLFKAAYPITSERYIANAYKSIVMKELGCEETPGISSEKKTIDYANGYIEYIGCGAPPPRVECCYWNCKDGSKLLVINVVGVNESIYGHETSIDVYEFRFDMVKGTIQHVFDALDLHTSNCILQLPRRGKDIKYTELTEDGLPKSSTVLKWDGYKFTATN